MSTALLLIDLQNDYFPGGAMELEGADAAVARCARLLEAFRSRGLPPIHVQHASTRTGATFFVPGTGGVEIHPAVAPRDGEAVFTKHFPNAFRDTPLLAHLRAQSITRLVIAGMMTQMCIDTSTRAASDMGFECTLAHDGCATRAQSFGGRTVASADVQAAFMASLNGLFAKVITTDEAIALIQLRLP
ncbi:MAG: cysteine hydrolase family protein [Betaproteobacteria bacterium]